MLAPDYVARARFQRMFEGMKRRVRGYALLQCFKIGGSGIGGWVQKAGCSSRGGVAPKSVNMQVVATPEKCPSQAMRRVHAIIQTDVARAQHRRLIGVCMVRLGHSWK